MPNTPPPDSPQGRAGNAKRCANCESLLAQSALVGACAFAAMHAGKLGIGRERPQPLRSVQNNAIASTACGGPFQHRASGIRGPMRVITREIFDGLTWNPVVSPDGVRAEITRLRGVLGGLDEPPSG